MNAFIEDVVAEAIRKQTFFQKNANTIVAGIGALVAVLSFVATLPLELPDVAKAAIPVVVSVLTTFAIKLTPNGVQPTTAQKLERTVAATRPPVLDPAVLVAEADRAREAARVGLAQQAPAIAAELERIRGDVAGAVDSFTGQHRAGE